MANEKEAGKKLTAKEWSKLNPEVQFTGRAITLPAEPGKMPLRVAADALIQKANDEEQVFRTHEVFDAEQHDAAVAFFKAMCRLYGWASPQTQQGMFGPRPPQMVSVKTGPGDSDVVQVPIGAFKLPGVDEQISTTFHDGKFIVYGEVKKRDSHLILEVVTLAREILKAESIYKGKPIKLYVDDFGSIDTNRPPEFIDVSDTSEASILFDQDVIDMIETNILVPIKYTKNCIKNGVPLKRCALLSGPYGTGKSLTARVIARVCQDNGWTFVLLNKVQGLRAALDFVKGRYEEAVVFAEDVDRVTSERNEQTNDLINTVDGVLSKNSRIMTILTTNHIEKIHPVMLRPGRLDAIISLRAPGAETVEKLMRLYARELISPKVKLNQAGLALAGHIPASIRECIERAKLSMLGRDDNQLTEHDIMVAANTMKTHLDLLKAREPKETVGDKLVSALHSAVNNGTGEKIMKIQRQVEEVHERICD
jgi:transitional endoplasmic reticulum ATPase